ncbi:hypothetical protein M3Y99_01185800 [Aphelenchoides fujianensis]|nr:hypothetical protein M3Y99_01185800 [Aphelenchoides fujianensis]
MNSEAVELLSYAAHKSPVRPTSRANQTLYNTVGQYDSTFDFPKPSTRQNQTAPAVPAEARRPSTSGVTVPRAPSLFTDRRIRERSGSREPPARPHVTKTVAFGRTTTIAAAGAAVEPQRPLTLERPHIPPRPLYVQPPARPTPAAVVQQPPQAPARPLVSPMPPPPPAAAAACTSCPKLQSEFEQLKKLVHQLIKDNVAVRQQYDAMHDENAEMRREMAEMRDDFDRELHALRTTLREERREERRTTKEKRAPIEEVPNGQSVLFSRASRAVNQKLQNNLNNRDTRTGRGSRDTRETRETRESRDYFRPANRTAAQVEPSVRECSLQDNEDDFAWNEPPELELTDEEDDNDLRFTSEMATTYASKPRR